MAPESTAAARRPAAGRACCCRSAGPLGAAPWEDAQRLAPAFCDVLLAVPKFTAVAGPAARGACCGSCGAPPAGGGGCHMDAWVRGSLER